MSNTTTVVVGPGNTIAVSAPGPQGPAGTGGAGGVTDGDKGSIVVTNSGTTWTLDTAAVATANIADDAVTFGKIQNITGPTILGRQNAAAGSVEQIGLSAAFTINGSKQLDLANALAASSTTLTAGTGLTGGGDLSANRTFAVAYGTTASTACEGNDARLSDARTPTAHTHALADLTQSSATNGQVVTWNGTAWAPATPSGGGGTDPVDVDLVAWHAVTQHPRWTAYTIGTGAAIGSSDSDSAAGVWRIEVGTQAVANRRASYTSGTHRFDAVTSSDFVASCSMSTNFSGTDTGWAAIGWIDSAAAAASDSNDGAYFRTTDGGNWYAVSRSNGSETATDSGTASGTTFVRLRIVVSEISSTWTAKYYVNGSLVATHTTNVPTGAGRHTGQGIMLNRTSATAVSCALDVDYVYTRIEYASAMVVT